MKKTLATAVSTSLLAFGVAAPALAETPAPEFVPYTVSASWLLPASWDYDTTPTYQSAIFPQTVLTGNVPACRWSQNDVYLLKSPADVALYESLDNDGVLTKGEDSKIYKSHVFVAGPACAPEPTPTPTETPTPTPTPTPTTPAVVPPATTPPAPKPPVTKPHPFTQAAPAPAPTLAATGGNGVYGLLGGILVVAGGTLLFLRRRFSTN